MPSTPEPCNSKRVTVTIVLVSGVRNMSSVRWKSPRPAATAASGPPPWRRQDAAGALHAPDTFGVPRTHWRLRASASVTPTEARAVTRIYSVAGTAQRAGRRYTDPPPPLPRTVPCGASATPHHLARGSHRPRPGEIRTWRAGQVSAWRTAACCSKLNCGSGLNRSSADEMPEFGQHGLEVLRQPLEDRTVTISRAVSPSGGSLTFPANFMLVGAQNPCPCGYWGDPEHTCSCSPMVISRYQKRLSGPLLDRIDIHVEVPRVPFQKLSDERRGEPSAADVRHDPGAGGGGAGAAIGPVRQRKGRPRRRPHLQRGHGPDPGARPLPGRRDRPAHRRCSARRCSG